MILLSIENTYLAKFKRAKYETATGITGQGANTRGKNYRALNFELEVFDENGCRIGTLPGGFPVTDTSSHNTPLVRFFRAIGIFRDPEEFKPSEIEGMDVRITINNIMGDHGLRSAVDRFYPVKV